MNRSARHIFVIALLLVAAPAQIANSAEFDTAKKLIATDAADTSVSVKSLTGLPLPRFASLRSGEVNMRTGPGTRYPIEWVYNRQGLPVEITAEYEIWRRVRDPEGNEGWVHKNELSGKRTAIVTGTADMMRELRDSADPAASIRAHLEPGSVAQISSCARDWCRLKFKGAKGYLAKTDFWGTYPAETLD